MQENNTHLSEVKLLSKDGAARSEDLIQESERNVYNTCDRRGVYTGIIRVQYIEGDSVNCVIEKKVPTNFATVTMLC